MERESVKSKVVVIGESDQKRIRSDQRCEL